MVPGTGWRIESPSPKNDVPRYGFIFGWSCISWRQPAAKHTAANRTKSPSLFLNLDITNFYRTQTLQQVNDLLVVNLRIVRLDREKESIASGEREIRRVENRMIGLRQFVQHEHSQNRGKRREQHRHFKSDRNERGPTVEWFP